MNTRSVFRVDLGQLLLMIPVSPVTIYNNEETLVYSMSTIIFTYM